MANAATNWKEFKSINPPIVINNNYLRGGASALILDDLAVIAGDDYFVKDAVSGAPILRAKGKEWSTRDVKTLYDTGGTAICIIKDEIITLHNTMKGEIEGVTLFEVSKHQGYTSDEDRFLVKYRDTDEELKRTINVIGDWLGRKAEIRLAPHGADKKDFTDGELVARVERASMATEFLAKNDSKDTATEEEVTTRYTVAVSPGVDLAFISAVCMCCDAIRAQTDY